MTEQTATIVAFEVVEDATGEVVARVDLAPANRHPRMAERVFMGLCRRTDLDRFHVREVEES